MAVLIAVDRAGIVEQLELDALGLGMLDLFLTGGQLVRGGLRSVPRSSL